MNKCAKCGKTVYPVEEIRCFEKLWHKGCFKCQSCNMTLSMRNYKGFDKLPYCGAHVPKAKATIVADTPEMKRLAENSKNQSNVQYHAQFEADKGKFITIIDEPEMLRIKANSQTISNVSYHKVAEQKAEQERKRSLVNDSRQQYTPSTTDSNPSEARNVESISAQIIESRKMSSGTSSPRSNSRNMTQNNVSPHPAHVNNYAKQNSIQARSQPMPPTPQGYHHHQVQQQQQQKQYQVQQHQVTQQQVHHQQPQPHYGRQPQSRPQYQSSIQQRVNYEVSNQMQQSMGRCYQALYDYEAQDTDEVSFQERDLIVNCVQIDAGWMTGTVHRTGEFGMLPANYVDLVNL